MKLETRRVLIALSVICLIGAVLRLVQLGAESYWLDEVSSVNRISGSLGDIFNTRVAQDTHPPLYYLLLKGWSAAFGDSERGTRSLSVVFGVLCIPLVFLVARSLFEEETGLVTALIVALSRFHIHHSQEARMYSALAFLSLASIILLLRLLRRCRRRDLVLYAVTSLALAFLHVYGVLALGFQLLWVLLRKRNEPVGKTLMVVQLSIGLLFVLWLLLFTAQSDRVSLIGWIKKPTMATVFRTFAEYIGGQEWKVAFFTALATIGLFSFTKLRGAWELRKPISSLHTFEWKVSLADPGALSFLGLWLGCIVGLPLAFSLVAIPLYVTKYTIAASFPVYILVARSVQFFQTRKWRILLLASMVLTCSQPLVPYYRDFQNEQWRDVASLLCEEASVDEVVFVWPSGFYEALHYYYREASPEAYPLGPTPGTVPRVNKEILTTDQLPSILAGKEGFWTIVAYSGEGYPKEYFEEYGMRESHYVFAELNVFHYVLRK